jgi:hypothetical protein
VERYSTYSTRRFFIMLQPRIVRSSSSLAAAVIHRFSGLRSDALSPAFSTTRAVAAEEESQDDGVVDLFRVFGFPRQFKISSSELKREFYQLMTKHHPDKNREKSLPERNSIEEKAAEITHAFQTLNNPHLRATHLLELLGSPVSMICA